MVVRGGEEGWGRRLRGCWGVRVSRTGECLSGAVKGLWTMEGERVALEDKSSEGPVDPRRITSLRR